MQAGVDEQVVVFSLGTEQYAVTIAAVKEVVNWSQPTWVPEAPQTVEGVIDLRGDVIPVVDLAKRLRAQRTKPPEEGRIMVMEVSGRHIGLVVDDVTEVLKVAAGQLAPASPVTQNTSDPIVRGLVKVQSRLLVLVDAELIVTTTGALELAGRAKGSPK